MSEHSRKRRLGEAFAAALGGVRLWEDQEMVPPSRGDDEGLRWHRTRLLTTGGTTAGQSTYKFTSALASEAWDARSVHSEVFGGRLKGALIN